KGDTMGVFQIESRAQMAMLPRLKPRCYYDLVIEVAIIRPGPIQGDMVHPYLRRRNGEEVITYPSDAVKDVLSRTLGVPIFQEQVMQLAMVAAGFSAGEADQLRRSMAAWKRKGGLDQFEGKLLEGMKARGYSEQFAQQIFNQIKGFGEYGFPESHSASFALLAYASSWLKCYHHAAFTCALLNSQPMGFYAPAQLVADARKHGVHVLPVDVCISAHDSTLEFTGDNGSSEITSKKQSLRLGLRIIKGLSSTGIDNIICARKQRPFANVQDMATRAKLNKKDMECLAAANALKSLTGDRHRAYWQIAGIENNIPIFETPQFLEGDVMLPIPSEGQNITADYATTGLTLGRHPLALLRDRLSRRRIRKAEELWELNNDTKVTTAGLVICRQRPGSANNVVFVTLEDETGQTNVVVWPQLAERQARELLNAHLLCVQGSIQQEDGVLHLIAFRLQDLSTWLGDLSVHSRDFC
ncbi:MAG: OB-fold nucleic acid binding domain-containing protein, partial [Gammaproteobacteria bacterium]